MCTGAMRHDDDDDDDAYETPTWKARRCNILQGLY